MGTRRKRHTVEREERLDRTTMKPSRLGSGLASCPGHQGDQMSFEQNRPKMQPNTTFLKINAYVILTVEKIVKKCGLFLQLKNCPK
jgi:hypothetical protein